MAKVNLSGLNVEGLMELRKQIDVALHKRRAEIQKQLETITLLGGETVARRGGRNASALKGRKVPPKYRGPKGETWAGRGARPRWLVAAVKEGKKLENFLIDKSGRRRRKKR
jgi:DNA-binding protein H-NS